MFGRLGEDLADEVVVAVVQSSPEPSLEIHCHGGAQVVSWLIELFAARGAAPCAWPELLLTTEKRLESTATQYLSKTTTLRAAKILLDQQQGAMRGGLEQIRHRLEAENASAAAQEIQAILQFSALGMHLVTPFRVVVAGPPNAGKSSLVNALAGFQRSIVSPLPGTTRDAVSTFLAIDGWPVELIDTAGIHGGAGGLEHEGIGLAREQIGACDLCLWLMDVTIPKVSPEVPLLESGFLSLPVANKIDQPALWATAEHCAVSALTGEGLTGLCHKISRRLVPDAPSPGAAVPFCSDVMTALQAMKQAIADGKIASALAICNSWL
jgi:tRNA modification GTPase